MSLALRYSDKWANQFRMSSNGRSVETRDGDKEREERLANLSGAMAIARLTHQVKQLELQTHQQDKVAKPIFIPVSCIMYDAYNFFLITAILES